METIEWQDFKRVELRVGTIIHAEPNAKARKPAWVVDIDPGEPGVKRSGAHDADGSVALAEFTLPVPDGTRLA